MAASDGRPSEVASDNAAKAAPMSDVLTAFVSLRVGDRFRFVRTFSEADASLFVGITGDYNPYHTDAAFSAGTRFGRPILPGLLVASMLTHIGGLLGVLAREMTFEFVQPVYPGETVSMELRIAELEPERRRMVLTGEYRVGEDRVVLRCRAVGMPTRLRLRPERDSV